MGVRSTRDRCFLEQQAEAWLLHMHRSEGPAATASDAAHSSYHSQQHWPGPNLSPARASPDYGRYNTQVGYPQQQYLAGGHQQVCFPRPPPPPPHHPFHPPHLPAPGFACLRLCFARTRASSWKCCSVGKWYLVNELCMCLLALLQQFTTLPLYTPTPPPLSQAAFQSACWARADLGGLAAKAAKLQLSALFMMFF